jgi:hypothetical protein
MTTTDTRLHMGRRDQGLLQIGRLQVQIEFCQARIASATTEAEADIPRSSLEMYRRLLETETATLPAPTNTHTRE